MTPKWLKKKGAKPTTKKPGSKPRMKPPPLKKMAMKKGIY
jgi:hypothetical protein